MKPPKIILNTRDEAIEELNKQFEIFLGAQKNDDTMETLVSAQKIKWLVDGVVSDVRQVNKKIITLPT